MRVVAHRVGTFKLSVRVHDTTTPGAFFDASIDVHVFDEARFTHPASDATRHELVIMSPGSQYHVRTNLDKHAHKITYELRHFAPTTTTNSDQCDNDTLSVSASGLLTASPSTTGQRQCTAALLVTFYATDTGALASHAPLSPKTSPTQTNSQQLLLSKQQSLVLSVHVRAIAYAMLELVDDSLLRHARLVSATSPSVADVKLRVDERQLARASWSLSVRDRVQMRWLVAYYDETGDAFHVVSTAAKYTLNQPDMVRVEREQAVLGAALHYAPFLPPASIKNQLVLLDQDEQAGGSFRMKVARAGRLVVELQADVVAHPPPAATSTSQRQHQRHLFKDYIGLVVRTEQEQAAASDDRSEAETRVSANIGDLVCLAPRQRAQQQQQLWSSQAPSVVRIAADSSFAACLAEGSVLLLESERSVDLSLVKSGFVQVDVARVEKISHVPLEHDATALSQQHVTNAFDVDAEATTTTTTTNGRKTVFVHFQVGSRQQPLIVSVERSNCSSEQIASTLQVNINRDIVISKVKY